MLEYLFGAASFLPHGICLLWRPDLVAMHVGGDLLTFGSYMAISLAIWRFTQMRPEFKYDKAALLFAAFVFGCGITHLVGMLTLWFPAYGAQGLLKIMVAMISVAAAVAIWRLLPTIVDYPTTTEIKARETLLRNEVAQRKRAEAEIERREEAERRLRDRETELLDALKRAEAADNAKDRFFAAMSHDLRTPLNAIIGFSEALEMGIAGDLTDTRQKEYVGIINLSAHRLLSLIGDLLNLSNPDDQSGSPHNPERHDISDMLSEIVTEAMPLSAQNGIALKLNATSDLPTIFADPDSCRRMISNIVTNAIKYTPKGGTVEVDVALDRDTLTVIVEDNGPGFDDNEIATLHMPYVQGKLSTDGVGLGLSIVTEKMVQHGGTMVLSNRKSGGARVELRFPMPELADNSLDSKIVA